MNIWIILLVDLCFSDEQLHVDLMMDNFFVVDGVTGDEHLSYR